MGALEKIAVFYVVLINMAGFVLMGMDKHRAKRHQWRIPEKTLFLMALLMGSLGSWAGMYVFHHKTRHWYFVVGMPVILMVQTVLLVMLFNR